MSEAQAVKRELTEQSRFREALGNPRSLEVGGSARHPRLTGDLEDGTHVVVLIKYTGYLNARRFRHWLTVAPRELEAAANPPNGFRYYVAQVGRLPNDEPWWIALWDLTALLVLAKDGADVFNKVPMDGGWFWRVDPAAMFALNGPQPVTLDLQTMELGLGDPAKDPTFVVTIKMLWQAATQEDALADAALAFDPTGEDKYEFSAEPVA